MPPKPQAARAADGTRKKAIKAILAGLLLLVVGYVVKGKVLKAHYRAGETVPPGQVVALNAVTTNLSDGHLARVAVSLQLTKPANPKEVTSDEPRLLATIVSYLGRQSYHGLLSPSGRSRLDAFLLHRFQQELGPVDGARQVSAVYLTGFLLQ